MTTTATSTHPAALLRWYVEMGIDVGLDEAPVDRLAPRAEAEKIMRQPAPPVPDDYPETDYAGPPDDEDTEHQQRRVPAALPRTIISPTSQPVVSTEETTRAANDAAKAATTLEELRAALEAFDGCGLRKTATQLVFSDGTPGSRVMLVGEAPGRDEDIQGVPFVGRSGQLLDRMLGAIGLDRTSVYIANVVPWRPPGNRTPTPQETAACRPFIARQIELSNPDFLICLGAPSAAELLNNRAGILKFRGQWRTFDTGTREIRAMATLHPAYLLRQPLQKRLAWRDFLMLREALDAQ